MATKYVFAGSHSRGVFSMYRIDNQIGRRAEQACVMYRSLRTDIGRKTGDVILREDSGPAYSPGRGGMAAP